MSIYNTPPSSPTRLERSVRSVRSPAGGDKRRAGEKLSAATGQKSPIKKKNKKKGGQPHRVSLSPEDSAAEAEKTAKKKTAAATEKRKEVAAEKKRATALKKAAAQDEKKKAALARKTALVADKRNEAVSKRSAAEAEKQLAERAEKTAAAAEKKAAAEAKRAEMASGRKKKTAAAGAKKGAAAAKRAAKAAQKNAAAAQRKAAAVEKKALAAEMRVAADDKRAASAKENKKKSPPKNQVLNNNFIWKIRPDTFDKKRFEKGHPTVYTSAQMESHDDALSRQIAFNFAETRASRKAEQDDRQMRSREVVFDLTSSPFEDGGKVSFKDLSRYTVEDVLKCREGEPFLLCIHTSCDSKNEHDGGLAVAAAAQKLAGLGGEQCRIGNTTQDDSGTFFCLRTTIVNADMHAQFELGYSQAQFLKDFETGRGDFVLSVDGTKKSIPIEWRQLVHRADEMMLFGTQINNLRRFAPLFREKGDAEYAHHVFRQFALEYKGDSRASALLYAAYQNCLKNGLAKELGRKKAEMDVYLSKASWGIE
jgi:hypothetical protein